ncbi:MAG TPA: uroporphyrinogen-III synthase [Puia sp.]|jgi:uroporphyrinogen-III synthase|nr:uroporphyrinogen-III synthase [Puia sp.]
MWLHKINILSTRSLEQKLIDKAAAKNVSIHAISFIETAAIDDTDLKEEMNNLLHQQKAVVFTSINAVQNVAKYVDRVEPDWRIFCIGSATKARVKEIFGETKIAGTADSARALADTIIAKQNISSVVFFCGNQRREELGEKLSQHGIAVKEMVVYETMQSPHLVTNDYDGILFYSPSAVNSFFSINKINPRTILFAIGGTTENEIKKFSGNKIIVAKQTSKELLVAQAIDFFQTNH